MKLFFRAQEIEVTCKSHGTVTLKPTVASVTALEAFTSKQRKTSALTIWDQAETGTLSVIKKLKGSDWNWVTSMCHQLSNYGQVSNLSLEQQDFEAFAKFCNLPCNQK